MEPFLMDLVLDNMNLGEAELQALLKSNSAIESVTTYKQSYYKKPRWILRVCPNTKVDSYVILKNSQKLGWYGLQWAWSLHILQYAMNQEADSLAKEWVTRSEFMIGTIQYRGNLLFFERHLLFW